jgi:hypothetical protein
MFLYFSIPTAIIGAALFFTVFTVKGWFGNRKHFTPQTVALSERQIAFTSADGTYSVPWEGYRRFKETRRSFLIWQGFAGHWLLLPKSALPTSQAIDRCRELLQAHLAASDWFFGH